jgi:hypothetical protein
VGDEVGLDPTRLRTIVARGLFFAEQRMIGPPALLMHVACRAAAPERATSRFTRTSQVSNDVARVDSVKSHQKKCGAAGEDVASAVLKLATNSGRCRPLRRRPLRSVKSPAWPADGLG